MKFLRVDVIVMQVENGFEFGIIFLEIGRRQLQNEFGRPGVVWMLLLILYISKEVVKHCSALTNPDVD